MGKAGRILGAIIILVGAVLLIAALFTPWYEIQLKESSGGVSVTGTYHTYPGLPSTNGTVQTTYSCSGLPSGASCPATNTTSYSKADLNSTGQLAETGYFLLIGGFILGLIGAILGFASGRRGRRGGGAIALGVVAMILAVAAFGLFAVMLPAAIGNDSPDHQGFNGPWSSFMGSGNSSYFGLPGGTATWGPGIGWYLAIGAFVVLLVGVIVLGLSRKDPPEPVPVSVPEETTATSPSGSAAPAPSAET